MARSRRRVLAGLAALVPLAGCTAGLRAPRADDSAGADGTPAPPTPAGGGTGTGANASEAGGDRQAWLAAQGSPETICAAEPRADPGIYAVVDPAFGSDWAGVDVDVDRRYLFGDATPADPLPASATVIGMERDGRARAYPLAVVWWHEVVNDDFGGPTLVTYCPICRTGTVVDRVVAGAPTEFVVSGHLWRPPPLFQAAAEADGRAFGASTTDPDAAARVSGNLVLVDRATGSLWSQVLAQAICGPETGTRLSIRPSTVTTWGAWRDAHPDTDVLLPPPASTLARP